MPHENRAQGTNGDYPEVSYTFVRHVVEGLMGLEPETGRGMPSTRSRLPKEIGQVTLHRQNIGANQITLTHIGRRVSVLRNLAGERIRWTAGFVGCHETVLVNNQPIPATICEKCGILFSEVTVSVEADREIRIALPL